MMQDTKMIQTVVAEGESAGTTDSMLTTEPTWWPQDSIDVTHLSALLAIAAQDIEPADFGIVTPEDTELPQIASGGRDQHPCSMIITWQEKNFRVLALSTFSSTEKEREDPHMR
jgi:hypothetical protein